MAKEPTLIAAGDQWADAERVKLAAVWLQFLLISPSYELARKYRTASISEMDKLRVPADFEIVLAVYDDLGDVRQEEFESWWLGKAFKYLAIKVRSLPLHQSMHFFIVTKTRLLELPFNLSNS